MNSIRRTAMLGTAATFALCGLFYFVPETFVVFLGGALVFTVYKVWEITLS